MRQAIVEYEPVSSLRLMTNPALPEGQAVVVQQYFLMSYCQVSNLPIHGGATDKADRRGLAAAGIARLLSDFISIFITVQPSDMLGNCRNLTPHRCKIRFWCK